MKLLKRFWPVAVIFLIWFVFSVPYLAGSKTPFPSAYQVNFFSPWSTYSEFAGPVKNNATPDVIGQIYPWKHFTIETLKTGEIPFWNPYSFSGTPHLANYQSAVFSPFNLLFFILPFIDAWSISVLLQPLLAGLFMYLLMRSLSVKEKGSLVSSIAFMFCGFMTTWMGYATLGYSILFLPLAIFSIEKFYSTNRIRYLLLLSLTIPLSFFSGHFQISLYFFVFVLGYVLFKSFQIKNKQSTFYLALFALLGVFFSLPQILPSVELYLQTLRSTLFEKGEIIPWGYLSTFLAPDFLGNPVTRNDWFGHYAEWNAYIGLIPLMLAFYAFMGKKITRVLFFVISAFVALLLAFQTPILDLLVAMRVPVLSTSAASRIIVLFSFSFAVLAGFGFEFLSADIEKKNLKKILLWLSGFFMAFIFLWSVVVFKIILPIDKIVIAKQNLLLPTAIFSLFSFLILFLLFGEKIKINKNVRQAVYFFVIALIAFDLLRFAVKWQAFDSKSLAFTDLPITREFEKISGYERVIGNFGAEVSVYYNLPSIEGYDASYIKRYGEFVADFDKSRVQDFKRSVISFSRNGVNTPKAVNLLGVKYIVHKISDGNNVWAFPYWDYPKDAFTLIYADATYQIYINNNALPRAFLVNKYKVANTPKEALNTMFENNFDLKNSIVLSKDPGVPFSENFEGKASITNYGVNRVQIKTQANSQALLFLSDSYYSGWKAYVDGKETEIYLADYSFRAVAVPQGSHTVTFAYNPLSFKIGILTAVLGGISGLVFCLSLIRGKKILL